MPGGKARQAARLRPEMTRLALPVLIAVLLAAAPAAFAAAWSPPRAADGHPDLSGVWSNASVTKLTRFPGVPGLTMSEAAARAFARANPHVMRLDADARPSDAEGGAPAPGDPGGYNAYWLDPGRTVAQVKGEYRTSWIVDPADGQLPLSEAGKALVRTANAYARAADTPANPEALEPWDRCLIASRGSGGPGMLNNIYNSNLQIVQAPGQVAIVIEMIHDARTIPVFPSKAAAQAAHGPAALHRWLGDSTAWWEGDTLVVETVDVNAEQGRAGPIFLTPKGRVTERFTRVSPEQIFYAFEVEDPTYYTRPWRAEMSLNRSKDQLFEYACHEGNYALVDIMNGVRANEAKAAQ
jgi:hypothetical protein